MRQRRLLTGWDTAPLQIVDTVELEMLEGLAERGPVGASDRIAWRLGPHRFRATGTLGAFGRPRLAPGSVEMANGETLPLSRRKRKQVMSGVLDLVKGRLV